MTSIRLRRGLLLGGPIVFTVVWLLLGASHEGYSQAADSLSVLAAFGAPRAWVMLLAFLVQAAATAAAGTVLLRSRPRRPWRCAAGGLLLTNAVATLVVAGARISCGPGDASWCRVTPHPGPETLHVAAATVALVALSLAPLAFATGTSAGRARNLGAVTGLVMLVALGWFARADAAGWAEKVAVTLGIGWAAGTAFRLAPLAGTADPPRPA